jgi:hypothetical protein
MTDHIVFPASALRGHARARSRARRGISVVYFAPLLLVLFGMISLAVDLGRVRTSKAQLSTAADAGALAGALALPGADLGAAEARAIDVAGQNQCDGSTVVVQSGDVTFGIYRTASRTFTVLGATEPNGNVVEDFECNAIRVAPPRTEARGNPIDLTFARLVNKPTFDLVASATAYVRGGRRGFGIVGIDWVRMNGTVRTDSYSSEPYDPSNFNHNGTVASNGVIELVGTADIYGDARPGVDSYVDKNANSTIHGWAAPLDEPLIYPPATVPAGVPNSGQLKLNGNETRTLSPGTYWFTSIKMTGNTTLIIQPDVKIYVTGNIDMTGGIVTNPGAPSGFELFKVGPGTVDLGGGSTLKAHVYAPEADVVIHGTQGTFGLFGWVVGKTLDIRGNSAIHYDETLEHLNLPWRGVLVR